MDFDKDSIKKSTNDIVSTILSSRDDSSDGKNNRPRLFWIWIWIVALAITSLGIVGVYFIIKNSNDKIASSYKNSVVSYLNDVHDTASSSGADPSEISYEVSKLKFPELVGVSFDSFSEDYKDAKNIEKDTKMAISSLRSKIADCVSVYDFYNQWKSIENKLTEIGNTASPTTRTYEEFRVALGSFVLLIDNATMPKELVIYNSELRLSAQNLYNSWNSLIDAYMANNKIAYSIAFSDYEKNSKLVESSVEPYKIYYDNLSSKVKSAADGIKIYEESLK